VGCALLSFGSYPTAIWPLPCHPSQAPVPLMIRYGPRCALPTGVWGSKPILTVPSWQVISLSTSPISGVPCSSLNLPPGQKGESPMVDPLTTCPWGCLRAS